MFSPFERMVAFRYLRARRKEGFISVIAGFSLVGIALGVATLIVVMAVMDGFHKELLSRILGVNGHIMVYSRDANIQDYEGVMAQVREMDGVTSVLPFAEGQVMAVSPRTAVGAMVKGFRRKDLRSKPLLADSLSEASLAAFEGRDNVLIGEKLAHRLGLQAGDELTLISPKGRATLMGFVPRMKAYTIAGIFKVGMYDYDSGVVLMPLEAAQLYFGLGKGVSALEAMVTNPSEAGQMAARLAMVLGSDYRVYDWQRANTQFFNALKVERNVMFLILTLIIIVAAFNIISGLIMLVKDKGRDIAILRTMGATRGAVMRIFILSGSSIGGVGTLAGLALGLAFALNIESIRHFLEGLTDTELFAEEIYFLSTLPADVQSGDVLTIMGMALGLSFLATIYPAWRAARLDPAEALRYE